MTPRDLNPWSAPERERGSGLLDALALGRPGAVVSLVGAGGKTSLALWLLAEGHQAGWPAVFTTTTHIQEPVLEPGECLLLSQEPGFSAALDRCLRQDIRVFLAAERSDLWAEDDPGSAILPGRFGRRKLRGLAPSEVDDLAGRYPDTLMLVEADGARHRLLKAPAEYEPQIPRGTTHLLVVAAADVVGKPLSSEAVHRPERLAALLQVDAGIAMTPHLVAEALAHPRGGLKGAPSAAVVLPVLTLLEEPWPLEAAREIAQHLLEVPRIGWVVLASLRPSWRVVEVVRR